MTQSTHTKETKQIVEKGDEQIANTNNMLKSIRKDIPMGADITYVTISHIMGHDKEDYVFFGLGLTIVLMSFVVGLFQYLIISQKNKWYYNAIYACECKHCYAKKHISYCLQVPKHKFLGLISAILHIISFLTFVYFHGEPFKHYGIYSKDLSFIFLVVWTFVNGVIHKIVQINVPKYVVINMNEIRTLKNRKKELLASQYKKKIQKRYNGMVEKHIEYIQTKVTNNKDCFCEHDMNNVAFAELEMGLAESDVEEDKELVELETKIGNYKSVDKYLKDGIKTIIKKSEDPKNIYHTKIKDEIQIIIDKKDQDPEIEEIK